MTHDDKNDEGLARVDERPWPMTGDGLLMSSEESGGETLSGELKRVSRLDRSETLTGSAVAP